MNSVRSQLFGLASLFLVVWGLVFLFAFEFGFWSVSREVHEPKHATEAVTACLGTMKTLGEV